MSNMTKLMEEGQATCSATLQPYESHVKDAYINCVRCRTELFLGIELARLADTIRCHICGVNNLLGDIDKIRRERVMKVAKRTKRA